MNKKKSIVAGVITCFLILGITSSILYKRFRFYKEIELRATLNAALSAKINFENCLNRGMSEAKTLGFIVVNYGFPADFEKLASNLTKNNKCTAAIQLLEGGVIKQVYPLEPNKKALGHDILNDSSRNADALEAVRRRSFYFAGPVPLIQGGVGVIGRMPLFRDTGFIGFAAIIIKFEDLLNTANLNNSETNYFEYQLIKVSPSTGQKEYFISGDPDFAKANAVSVEIPLGSWILNARPKQPFSMSTLSYTIVLGLLISIVSGIFVGYLFYIPERLKYLVLERTKLLHAHEAELKRKIIQIKNQNEQLNEMSWAQSHKVRAPLARLLGLTSLLKMSEKLTDREREIAEHIQKSAEEFDDTIKKMAETPDLTK